MTITSMRPAGRPASPPKPISDPSSSKQPRLSIELHIAVCVNAIMAEVMAQDLRADLPKIAVPVLLVAPFFEADAVMRGITQPMAKEYYTSLMQGTPKLTVVSIAPSRHFVMFDQPELLAETLSGFIKTL